jgi:sensor domain CHASE-containing protein
MFVVDGQGNLIYAGAIDDDPEGKRAASERLLYVDLALQATLHGVDLSICETKPYGCSVKYAP